MIEYLKPVRWHQKNEITKSPIQSAVSCLLKSFYLSVGSTVTKYIRLKTKTQNNIGIFGVFQKSDVVILAFFWKNLTEIRVFTKKSAVLVFGFLVF